MTWLGEIIKEIVFVYKHGLLELFMESYSEIENKKKKYEHVCMFPIVFHELLDQPAWCVGIASTFGGKVDLVLKVL